MRQRSTQPLVTPHIKNSCNFAYQLQKINLNDIQKPDYFELLRNKFTPIEDSEDAIDLKMAPNISPRNYGEQPSEEEYSENDAQVFERKGPRKT